LRRLIPDRFFWPLVALLLAFMAACMTRAALNESQAYDEGFHLVAGLSYWTKGDFRLNPEHPPLGKLLSGAPLLAYSVRLPDMPEAWNNANQVAFSDPFLYHNQLSARKLLLLGRLAIIAVTLALGLAIAIWTRSRFSAAATLIALFLLATDSNFLAHGHYITTDVLAAATFFLAAITWAFYLESGKLIHLAAAAVALGLALAGKYSALFLIPVHLLLYLLFRAQGRRRVFTVMAGALVVLALVYGPESAKLFRKDALEPMTQHTTLNTTAGVKAHYVSTLLHLPAHRYLLGLWMVASHNEEGQHSYLLGRITQGGDWRYFPIAFLVKTPTATLLLIVMTVLALPWLLRPWSPSRTALLLYPLIYFGWCISSRLNIGHRHLLPVYPFLFVAAGIALSHCWRQKWPRVTLVVLIAAVSIQAAELARVHPHYLSFFNTLAGGPISGPRYLLDSNIDWGQDARYLKAWMDRNRIEVVCLSYFGLANLQYYGIREAPLVLMNEQERAEQDCVAAISVNNLYDLYLPEGTHAWARRLKPVGRIGYSMYLYDLRKDHSRPLLP